jgi:ornithine carbamoyltransferase
VSAVKKADYLYTDVWTSMGQEEETRRRMTVFKPFQINTKLLKTAPKHCKVMHCLPAHRGQEITDEVLSSDACIVFDQAENRLHVQKAVLATLLR